MARIPATRSLRVVAALAILLVMVPLVASRFEVFPTRQFGDPWNYLAAAERLNAGHPLYSLSPGDRPVEVRLPYWPIALMSPPLIAVIWRPLALFGDTAMLLWWIGGTLATGTFVVWLLSRLDRAWQVFALMAVAPSLVLGALTGNAIGYLIPLLALRHPATAALGAAVRLTPALLAPAVGLRGTIAFGVALGAISLLGAGVQNHIDWLSGVTTPPPTPLSISAITGLPPLAVAIPCAIVALAGWRPAVIAMTLASPVTYFYTFGTLALLLVPPARDRDGWGHRTPREPAGTIVELSTGTTG